MQRNFESLADLARAGAMEEGVMVAAGAMEEEGVGSASITPKQLGRCQSKNGNSVDMHPAGKDKKKTSVS